MISRTYQYYKFMDIYDGSKINLNYATDKESGMFKKLSKIVIGSSLLLLPSGVFAASVEWGADEAWMKTHSAPNHTKMLKAFEKTKNVKWIDDYHNNIEETISKCAPGYCVVKVVNPGFALEGFQLNRSKTKIEGVDNPIIKPDRNGDYITIWEENNNLDHLVIEGLTLEKHDFGASTFNGVHIRSHSIKDLVIRNITAKGLHSSYNGCVICVTGIGTTDKKAIKRLTISDNTITDIITGDSEVIAIDGNIKDWEITRNILKDISFIGIDVGGGNGSAPYKVDAARYGFITDNHISEVSLHDKINGNNLGDQGVGVYIDGGRNILISGNIIDQTPGAFSIGAEECIKTKNITVTKNVATATRVDSSSRRWGAIHAGAFYKDNRYKGYNKKGLSSSPCNDKNINGKGYVEHITITGNYFNDLGYDQTFDETINHIRLTHALIDKGLGFSEVNQNGKGNAKGNKNAIKHNQSSVSSIGVIAKNDRASVKQGKKVTIDVLANDSGTNLAIYAVDAVWEGSIKIVNNKLVYKSSGGSFKGNVEVWYGVRDSKNNEHWAMVTIKISKK